MLASNYLDNLDMGPDKMGSELFHCYTKIKLGLPILDISGILVRTASIKGGSFLSRCVVRRGSEYLVG